MTRRDLPSRRRGIDRLSGAALAGVIAALLLGAQAFAAGAREIVGIPIVEDDGSLTIKGQAIELYGSIFRRPSASAGAGSAPSAVLRAAHLRSTSASGGS